MASLDSEDRSSGGEVAGVVNVRCRSEVGRGSDTLEDARDGDEGVDRVEAEVVLAAAKGVTCQLVIRLVR